MFDNNTLGNKYYGTTIEFILQNVKYGSSIQEDSESVCEDIVKMLTNELNKIKINEIFISNKKCYREIFWFVWKFIRSYMLNKSDINEDSISFLKEHSLHSNENFSCIEINLSESMTGKKIFFAPNIFYKWTKETNRFFPQFHPYIFQLLLCFNFLKKTNNIRVPKILQLVIISELSNIITLQLKIIRRGFFFFK